MTRRRLLILLFVAIGLAGLAAYAWQASRTQTPAVAIPTAADGAEEEAITVEAALSERRTVIDDVSAVGSLVSNESVVLRPEVAGRIARIAFADGALVKKGEVLVELDAAVQRAEQQQAEASLKLAQANFHRTEGLFARKFVSQSSLDQARAELELARAALALTEARLARTLIRAPFDGRVGIRNVSPGDYVKDGDALINLEDIARLKVDFRLPELYLDRIRLGQELELSTDVLPGEVFAARIDAMDPLVDAQGRAVRLRASLNNSEARLRPGGFVRVRLILAERAAVLVVPESALVPAPGKQQFVYQILGDEARRVEVQTGMRREALVEITAGLDEGALVVTAGQLKLRDGARVQVLEEAS